MNYQKKRCSSSQRNGRVVGGIAVERNLLTPHECLILRIGDMSLDTCVQGVSNLIILGDRPSPIPDPDLMNGAATGESCLTLKVSVNFLFP